ncbi:aspartate/glutamate racemase family protein [Ruegeria arenilitoris]|uniref:aspartate/glutamate racemase family protein n=1 Tax=Ruegeria arenilitoris TaxID=1173585 RepID=UPI00147BB533|nr:aspartate/glutamate racemase family protein [Ruegeria arenilitoris]
MIANGGKSLYGASVGILMLDARFPRIPGDMGNALTWPFPVHYRIVREATPDLVVRKSAKGLLDAFVDAAKELVKDGVDGITTNCGFLSLFQEELAAAVPIPVATSSLMQVGMVNRVLPAGKRAGILTISASTLTDDHLRKAQVPDGTPIGTTEGGEEFTRAILGNEPTLDVNKSRLDNVEAAMKLKSNNPDLGAIVLECTNMCPYAPDIQQATGLPVFSIVTFVSWFQSGLMPPRYQTPH